MIHKISGEIHIGNVHILAVHKLFKMIANQGLHLLHRHFRPTRAQVRVAHVPLLNSLRLKSDFETLPPILKRHDLVLKGHDFSRAGKTNNTIGALAPEGGCLALPRLLPQAVQAP
jgi:hypothetical protein